MDKKLVLCIAEESPTIHFKKRLKSIFYKLAPIILYKNEYSTYFGNLL